MQWWQIFLIIIAVLAGIIVVLWIIGKRAQKKQEEQQAQVEAAKQNVTMLIIDKKKMKLQDAGFPQIVQDSIPKRMRRMKFPIVKAKVGPKISTFIADRDVYDVIPVRKEVKAEVSGLYILRVHGIRGPLVSDKQKKKKKESRFDRLLRKGRGEI